MRRLAVLFTLCFGGAVVACGSDESTFGDPGPTPGTPNGIPAGGSLPEIGPNGTGSACVTEVASAELSPTNLVFMYDKSGSMGDVATGFDPNVKWTPVGTGMKDFFADPYSSTVHASLQFFPQNDVDIQTACDYGYAQPAVALALASDPAFTSALTQTTPSGGTPTLPALNGAIAYAKDVAAQRPGERTAVVLVTDGEPGFFDANQNAFVPGCPNNDIAHVADAAKQAFESTPSVPTYVIGVGPSLDKLNTIATAGGTNAAMMVDVSDPAKTKTAIAASLDQIRKRELTCDFTIPPAPAGQELDPYAVNVVLKAENGSEKVLGYSKDCTQRGGWRYDDAAAPTRIFLCADACTDARASSSLGKVSIAFGCKTRVAVN